MHTSLRVHTILAGSEVLSETNQTAGSIYSFLPAHGESRAGAVAELVGRTLTEGFGIDVLLADFDSFDDARTQHSVVCVDLTDADEAYAVEALRASDGIFLLAGSDAASLRSVREKAEWLHGIGVAEQCGLLLRRVPSGANAADAEDFTGLPVCSLIDDEEQIRRFAAWLAASQADRVEPEYALAG